MEFKVKIEDDDIQRLKEFYNNYKNNLFVQTRYKRNILRENLDTSLEILWKSLITCLLTSQQKSGPNSPISKLINTNPFPLSLEIIDKQESQLDFIQNTLSSFKGIRFTNKLPLMFYENHIFLSESNWQVIQTMISDLIEDSNQNKERYHARMIDKHLKGFGPKQSRNYIQTLGLSKYEIPLDSRIIKWLNSFGFPLKLSSTVLQDSVFYEFILDIIIDICGKAGIYPCILDAAIFASFDKDEWTEDSIIY